MSGFPASTLDSAFGSDALPRLRGVVAHLRREAHHKRLAAALVRADPTGGAEVAAHAAVLDLEAAEIEARIDSMDGDQSCR